MKKKLFVFELIFIILFATVLCSTAPRTVVDSIGRKIIIPNNVESIICSGPGCLRLIVYLQIQDKVVAVDGMEKRKNGFDVRPYAIANPQLKALPIFGEFRGHDNPELIMSLKKSPQIIFKTYASMGFDPIKLEKKTGIPVIVLNYGDLFNYKKEFFNSLKIIGKVMKKEKRASALINFFKNQIDELSQRGNDTVETRKKSCYVGGIAFKGPHGFLSTQPLYPPFMFINAKNVAKTGKFGNSLNNSMILKENIIKWNPDILFLDLSTIQMGKRASALYELKTEPVFKILSAVEKGNVYGLLPYNWYSTNYGSMLADSWFVGKILYPEKFKEIQPEKKADEIFTFLVGKSVFSVINETLKGLIFKKIDISK